MPGLREWGAGFRVGPEGHEQSLTQKLDLPFGLALIPVGDVWYHPPGLVQRFFMFLDEYSGPHRRTRC